jgi:hypothetical protein
MSRLRVEFKASPDFVYRLKRVAADAGLTAAEAIGVGVELLERLVEADKQGKGFIIVNKNSPEENQ